MKWIRSVVGWAALVVTVGAAVPAFAQDVNVTLYELTESARVRGGQIVRRMAVSSLGGWAVMGSPICPATLQGLPGVDPTKGCFVNVVAQDNINTSTGLGPVSGDFAVVIQLDNPVDGPELVVLKGSLDGTIDLSPALSGGLPLAFISGRWRAHGVEGGPAAGVRTRGTFQGTFHLPFCLVPGPGNSCAVAGYLFLDQVGNPSYVPVADDEKALGLPTVRLDVTFTGSGN